MLHIDFTPEQSDTLHQERFHHPHPRGPRKMEAVFLKSHGRPHHDIRRLVRISENTLRGSPRPFQDGGVARLQRTDGAGTESELDARRGTLEDPFRQNPPRAIAEAAAAIERITGVRRGLTRVRTFLKDVGLSYRKVGMIPAQADADEQAKVRDVTWWPRSRQAQRLRRVVGVVDAAHFVHGAFLGSVGCVPRLLVRGPSGRKRFHVRGAIAAVTHEVTPVVNDTVIDARAVRELLRGLSARDAGLPLTRVLDNARSQKGAVARLLAAELKIELLDVPSSSPNLNRIERLGKFGKKAVLSCRYHEDFSRFKAAIVECLEGIEGKHKDAIASLMTRNFQTFENPQLLSA